MSTLVSDATTGEERTALFAFSSTLLLRLLTTCCCCCRGGVAAATWMQPPPAASLRARRRIRCVVSSLLPQGTVKEMFRILKAAARWRIPHQPCCTTSHICCCCCSCARRVIASRWRSKRQMLLSWLPAAVDSNVVAVESAFLSTRV